MNTKEALEIKKAILTLEKALDTDFLQLASNVCMFDKEKFEVLKEASKLWNEFDDASHPERCKLLGIEITVPD